MSKAGKERESNKKVGDVMTGSTYLQTVVINPSSQVNLTFIMSLVRFACLTYRKGMSELGSQTAPAPPRWHDRTSEIHKDLKPYFPLCPAKNHAFTFE